MVDKYIPASTFDLFLNKVATADYESICSQAPLTYFNACRPPMWTHSSAYSVGDITRSPTDNNMVYECTVGGTSGAGEPPWSEVQDATFVDGTVTWKAHENYSLATMAIPTESKTLTGTGLTRSLTFGMLTGGVSHREGDITCTAFICSTTKTIEALTPSATTIPADNHILSGRTVIFHALIIPLTVF